MYISIIINFKIKQYCIVKKINILKKENGISLLLDELMMTKGDRIPHFKNIIKDYEKWGEVARRNRHFLTHLNKDRYADDIVEITILMSLTHKILAVILYYILENLGFTDERINDVFKNSRKFFIPNFF